MTTDAQLAPTDAELVALALDEGIKVRTGAGAVRFARAVLARWGQPARSGEPVAWLSPWRADQVTTDYDAYGEHGIPLYTAPQPVEREPLTANQVSGLAESAGYWHGDMSRADFINGIRYAEAAHGIKGGQHGTE